MTYTPTTESVRCAFIADGGWTAEDRAAMFDRWHAETIRQSKEQAWNQGAEAVALLIPEYEWHDRGLRLPTNPYRS